MNLIEAFKALDQLNEDVFSVDAEGIKKLNDFMQNDDSVDELSVFDIDSTEADVIRDDEECNGGDMILDCCVCHSKVFKPASEIVVDEESQIANVGEECPYCFSVEGYKVVGEVKTADDSEVSAEDDKVSDEQPDGVPFNMNTDDTEAVDSEVEGVDEFTDAAEDKVEDEPEVQESVKDRIIKCRMKDRKVDESVDLLTKDNTIASLLRDNMDDLNSITDANELRDAIIDIVNESDIADKPAALKLKRILYSNKSVNALMATIGTYMLGQRLIEPSRGYRKSRKESLKHHVSRKESFKHRRLHESEEEDFFLEMKDEYDLDPDFDIEDYIDGVYMEVSDELRKEKYKDLFIEPSTQMGRGGVFASFTADDGTLMKTSWDYSDEVEVLENEFYDASSYSEFKKAVKSFIDGKMEDAMPSVEESLKHHVSRKESFKHRRITEDVDTIKITSDDIIISMDNDDDESANGNIEDDSEEVILTDDAVVSPVSEDSKEEIELNSIDKDEAEEVIEESLKESFKNVKFFRASNVSGRSNRVIVEGIIGFNSGKKRNTKFVFKPSRITESSVILKCRGTNLSESVRSVYLTCSRKGKKLVTESMKLRK